MKRTRTLLDHALLGLLAQNAKSGYDLRKVFQETPLGLYSDSPGSIYPALRRLEKDGLVRTHAEQGGRRRRLCALTPAGRTALVHWLKSPITPGAIEAGEVELRLAFYSDVFGPAELRAFLADLVGAAQAIVRNLKTARPLLAGKLTKSATIAFEFGLHVSRARLAYYRGIVTSFRRKS